jgi:hypothetical protein
MLHTDIKRNKMVTLTPNMKEAIEKEKAEKAFLASATKIITDTSWDTSWKVISSIFGFSNEAEETSRLYRSQMFHDDDYPSCVMRFLENAFAVSPERAVSMVKYVIDELKKEGKIEEPEIARYPALKSFLENKNFTDFSFIMPKAATTKYLEVQELPDDFYRDLLDMINRAYAYELYVVVCLLARKMLENLLIDILRKRFGMEKLDLFYDTKYHGFREFKTLINNFENNLGEFQKIVPTLDSKFVKMLHSLREQGNSAAHTLEVQLTQKELIQNKESLEFAIKTLVRLFNNC